MKPQVLAAVLLLPLLSGLAVADVPEVSEWTTSTVETEPVDRLTVDRFGGVIALTYYDATNTELVVRVGVPGSLTTTTFDGRVYGCINNLGNAGEWGLALHSGSGGNWRWTQSDDDGETWSALAPFQTGNPTADTAECDIMRGSSDNIVIAWNNGAAATGFISRSVDDGSSWETQDVLPGSGVHNFAAIEPNLILTADGTGDVAVFHSLDDLDTWAFLTDVDTDCDCTSSTSSGFSGGTLSDGTAWVSWLETTQTNDPLRVARSTNGGSTWSLTTLYTSGVGSSNNNGNTPCVAQDMIVTCTVYDASSDDLVVVERDYDAGMTDSILLLEDVTGISSPVLTATETSLHLFIETGPGIDEYTTGTPSGIPPPGGGGGGGSERTFNGNLTPTHTIAVDALTGFDVGPDGSKVITRQSATPTGYMVRAYSGNNLATLGTFLEPDFMFHGVVAGNNNIAFVDKAATDNNGVLIKSADMSAPLRPSGCSTDTCPDAIADLDETGDFPDLQDVGEFAGVNVDYNKFVDCTVGNDWNIIGMSFSTSTGGVGLWAKFTLDGGDDEGELKTLATAFAGAGALPTQVNSWETNILFGESNGDRHYVAAVDPAGGAKVWSNRIDERASCLNSGAVVDDVGIVQHGQVFSAPGNYPDPLAIAGRHQTVVVATDDLIGAFDIASGQLLWEVADTGIQARSVATQPFVHDTSPTGTSQVVAYANATHLKVLDLPTGAPLAIGAAPPGTWRGTKLDAVGGVLFAATTDNVTRYDIHLATCVDACNPTNPDGGGGSDPPPTTDPTDPTGTIDPSLLKRAPVFFGFYPILEAVGQEEVTEDQWGYLVGIVLTGALAAAPAGNRRTRSPIVSVVLAFVGAVASYFLGYFHLAVPVLSAVLAAAVVIFQRR